MSPKSQLFPDPERRTVPVADRIDSAPHSAELEAGSAPIWLQRLSLITLVLFCIYLGAMVMVLPWWSRMWDQNLLIESQPALARILRLGAVRGLISGLGMLDIWIGISEALHYRESQ